MRARVIEDGQELAQAAAGIAPDVRLARPGVQRTADLLGVGDLAEYAANPAHGRAKLGRLTPAGRALSGKISEQQISWARDVVQALPAGTGEIRPAVGVPSHLRTELESSDPPAADPPAKNRRTRPDRAEAEPDIDGVLINPFEVPGGTDGEFLRQRDRAAACPQNQPGPVGARLHRAPWPDARFRSPPRRPRSPGWPGTGIPATRSAPSCSSGPASSSGTSATPRLSAHLPEHADAGQVADATAAAVNLHVGQLPFRMHIDPRRDGREVMAAHAMALQGATGPAPSATVDAVPTMPGSPALGAGP